MKIECKDLDHALREGSPELLEALSAHAGACPSCRAALDHWNELSNAAHAMHRSWDSLDLWPRIHQALAAESQAPRQKGFAPLGILQELGRSWHKVAAIAAVILLTVSIAWVLMRNFQPSIAQQPDPDAEKRLLTEKALREIETNESAYIQSIGKLSKLVEPRIDNATSPLMVSYREKLALIDAAIAECRADIERNRFNAHMRKELLSIYQEKQRTLEDVMRINQNDLQ
jgi:hypothetical protein